jgi:hypothetical protein
MRQTYFGKTVWATARFLMATLLAAGVFSLALTTASADDDAIVYQQVNGPPGPGPFWWGLDDIGWYWTPATNLDLVGVHAQLRTAPNINNNFTFTTTIYSDRPAVGGTPIATFSWNGTHFVEGLWLGGDFASPVPLVGGTRYFIGMAGWAQAIGWNGGNSGAGINWVDSPVGPPVQNLGAGSSWGTVGGPPGSYNTQFSPAGLGATDQPVIRFMALPVPVFAHSGTLIEGNGQENDFSATISSDDLRWGAFGTTLFYRVNDPVTQFELVTTALTGTPNTVCLIVEARKQSSSANLLVRANLYNFQSGQYVSLVGIQSLGTADSSQTFLLPGGANPEDFVDPNTLEMRALLQTSQTSGLSNVRTQIDQVRFIAN